MTFFRTTILALLALLPLAAACKGSSPPAADIPYDLNRADAAFLQGDFSRALHLYESYLKAHPVSPQRAEVLLRMAKCRMGSEEWQEALQVLGDALAACREETIRAEIFYRRALVYNALWEPDRALVDFRLLQAVPTGVRGEAVREDEFRYRFGVTLMRSGDWAGGKAQMLQVPAKSPLEDDARIRLSLDRFAVQIARCKDSGAARQTLDKAKKLNLDARIAEGAPAGGGPRTLVVLVGSYGRFEEARSEARRLRLIGFEGAFAIP